MRTLASLRANFVGGAALLCAAAATAVHGTAPGAAAPPGLAEADTPPRLVVFEAFSRPT